MSTHTFRAGFLFAGATMGQLLSLPLVIAGLLFLRQGGDLMTKGTMAGSLHQVWLKVTELFQSGDRAAIERVQEGENYLAEKFETALEETDLDSQSRAVIQRAMTEIRQGEQLADQLGRVGESTFDQ